MINQKDSVSEAPPERIWIDGTVSGMRTIYTEPPPADLPIKTTQYALVQPPVTVDEAARKAAEEIHQAYRKRHMIPVDELAAIISKHLNRGEQEI